MHLPRLRARWVRLASLILALALWGAGRAGAQGRPGPPGPPGPPGANDLVVRQLDFEGASSIPQDVLTSSIVTTNSSWFATSGFVRWLGLGAKRYFDERDFQADVLRLKILYRKYGYPDVQVDTLVRRTPEDVYITFRIHEGAPVRVDTLTVTGLDSFPERVQRLVTLDLPLRQGDVFNRFLMQASADTITTRLRDHGYPSADVFTGFTSHLAERLADVSLDVHPGTRAVIGRVEVIGAQRVDSGVVRDLLAARPGRRFSQTDLYQSQRNLYDSDLFRFASVQVDTATFEPGADSVPLVVRVTENPPLRLRTGVGYGTNDCFRGQGGVTLRDFLGRGRVVDFNARVSKVGVGSPADWGLADNWLCGPLQSDSIASRKLNYNLQTTWRRPAFLSPNNTLNLTAYTERRGEFKVYLRQETGASVGLVRRSPRRRIPISLTYTVSVGRTEASRATFCAFLQACLEGDVALLSERRGLATLTGAVSWPAVNNIVDPTRGHVYSTEVTWASRFIGSSRFLQFTRVQGDAAWYQPLSRDVVLSYHLHGGLIFAPRVQLTSGAPVAFVPPEQRFYAGGPNDVRGFRRNELGPVVYVVNEGYFTSDSVRGDPGRLNADSVLVTPIGGNTLAIGNVELRVPSPIFRERMRLAAFVDVGGLWQRGSEPFALSRLRVTPGVGLRIGTPLGPARLDVAYNASTLAPGRLYVASESGELTVAQENYPLPKARRFTFHFAVGQPF
ncbi:MAG TPA: BamA/TamA family outer membrane protein [Gemmatimonadales bacterium]|nr:BamA/TamA family outer membrane protein [Gemmatimonadales bacterium]